MSRNFCREIPNGFSNFWALVINKRLLVLPCPLQTVVIWVTVWVSGFLSKSALTILATKQRKVPKPWWFRNFYGCGGRTRTYDLRVMSPTSFQLLYSAICLVWLLVDYNMGGEGLSSVFFLSFGISKPTSYPQAKSPLNKKNKIKNGIYSVGCSCRYGGTPSSACKMTV